MTNHTFGCGCSVEIEGAEGDIIYCPLHDAAPALLGALEKAVERIAEGWSAELREEQMKRDPAIRKARAAIAQAKT